MKRPKFQHLKTKCVGPATAAVEGGGALCPRVSSMTSELQRDTMPAKLTVLSKFIKFAMRRAACCLAGTLLLAQAWAQSAVHESIITATFEDRSISALVTQLTEHDAYSRAILLMPGSPGIMKLQSPESFALKGNFLIRTRRAWLDRETIVFSVDAPTDRWGSFSGHFRSGKRYAEDIRGLVGEIFQAFGKLRLVIVGTSEGSVSAYFVARALQGENVQVIFSSSLFNNSRNSPGLAALDFDEFKIPMLWVHHTNDACRWTPFWQAQRHAEKTRSPLIAVRSSFWGRGEACEAFSPHGYAGVEEQTVAAMKQWVLDGVASDVLAP